jgi:hypothetical protein
MIGKKKNPSNSKPKKTLKKSLFSPYFPYLDFARKEDIGVGTSSKATGS